MNDKLAGLLLVLLAAVGVAVGLLGVVFLVGVLQPHRVRGGSARVRQTPGRCLLIGLLTALVFGAGLAVMQALPKGVRELVGLAWSLGFVYLLLNGIAMLGHAIGERVQSAVMARSLGSDALAIVYGTVPLLAAGLLPGVGQAVQLVGILVGLGGAVSDRVGRQKPPPVAAAGGGMA